LETAAVEPEWLAAYAPPAMAAINAAIATMSPAAPNCLCSLANIRLLLLL
jgi:hypothetical protein